MNDHLAADLRRIYQGNAWHVRLDNTEPSSQAATIHALCLKNKLKVK